jgi:putative endonuclease
LNNKKLGDLGERIAKIYLEINKYQILKCNFRSKLGEIDIIARRGNTLHFVEVKTRTSHFIEARLAINKQKQEHIWKTAEYYIYINKIRDMEIQFDAIEIYIEKESWQINYIPRSIEK